MGQKAAKIKRRRESSFYNELSQFHRLQSKAHLYVPSLSSPSKNYHSHRSPIWKPSFTFHFTAISVLKRYYRKLFKSKTQTLPYYKSVPSNDQNHKGNSSFLNYLSRNDNQQSVLYSDAINNPHKSVFDTARNWISYYWHHIFTAKAQKD